MEKGEQYVLFMTNGVGIINTALDVITSQQTAIFNPMGMANMEVPSLYASTTAAGWLEAYSPCISVPRQVRGSGCCLGGPECVGAARPGDQIPGRADDDLEDTKWGAFGVTTLVITGASTFPTGL